MKKCMLFEKDWDILGCARQIFYREIHSSRKIQLDILVFPCFLYFYLNISASWGFIIHCWHSIFWNVIFENQFRCYELSTSLSLFFFFFWASRCFLINVIILFLNLSPKYRCKVLFHQSLNARRTCLFSLFIYLFIFQE